ncbi:hypothetical protein LQV63_18615 [Paenibacillus profundus]|uniref:Uncharacterized protein n=1 Tax=Paenibacillus profundus TaxID=1173085 RepID=A0ABS8YIA5_9BACL|nr:hypothetical protein [Paenibacillus profundus]MCE5171317.1 hypothetical protein [Paenibacillus profundus]
MTRKWKSVLLLLAVMAMLGLILCCTATTAGMYVLAIVSAAISVLLLSASLARKSES